MYARIELGTNGFVVTTSRVVRRQRIETTVEFSEYVDAIDHVLSVADPRRDVIRDDTPWWSRPALQWIAPSPDAGHDGCI